MARLSLVVSLALIAACTADSPAVSETAPGADRPNILLIVVDDMGFSDLGSFGGEIDTPNLDRLAFEGIRFTNFNSAPMCSPARAMMFTGVDSHLAGFGTQPSEIAPNQEGRPGYEGYLNERVVSFSTLLSDAGYRTYISGKWHLGSGEGKGPSNNGFDRSFVLDSGGASHFADMRPAYAPSPDIKANYWEDGVKLHRLPDDFEYSTEFYVDKMIDYLDDGVDADKPFLAVLSFTAAHWPLQAPDTAIDAQKGNYDAGYDVVGMARLERQKALGLVPEHAVRGMRSPKERPWLELDEEIRKVEVRAMEIYAAMVAEVDRHTGRLIDYLEQRDILDETAVLFLSDNGPEGHDYEETWPMEGFPEIRRTIDATHDFSYEAMGKEGSYVFLGPGWANASSPALSLHKGFPTEGGTRSLAFVRYPGIIREPAIVDDFVYIEDIAATILEIAGVCHPGEEYAGRPIEPMTGRSFLPLLKGDARGETDRVIGMELLGKRAIREGRWKLVHMPAPWGTGDWQLFDIAADPAEAHDLAARHPDVFASLVAQWQDYAEANNVIIPDWVSGY
jgi:arylsulfatase